VTNLLQRPWSSEEGSEAAEGSWSDDEPISDDELTALALAADPGQPVDDDALPIDVYLRDTSSSLPQWYMAPVMARCTGRLGRAVILTVVSAFLLIEAFGLCSTYGQIPFH
jgi:hypothetical protein